MPPKWCSLAFCVFLSFYHPHGNKPTGVILRGPAVLGVSESYCPDVWFIPKQFEVPEIQNIGKKIFAYKTRTKTQEIQAGLCKKQQTNFKNTNWAAYFTCLKNIIKHKRPERAKLCTCTQNCGWASLSQETFPKEFWRTDYFFELLPIQSEPNVISFSFPKVTS